MSTSTLLHTKTALKYTGECLVPGCHQWSERVHLARYDFATSLTKGKTVLDIACGSGYGSNLLASAEAKKVVGVDINPENVKFARANYSSNNLSYFEGDIVTWGESCSYDVIVCFETIEHLSFYQKALANCRRLLKEGGKLLISSPNRPLSSPRLSFVTGKPENPFHVREFTPSELSLLMEAHGFSTSYSEVYGQVFQPKFNSFILTKAYRKLITRPFASLEVRPCKSTKKQPNYFLIMGTATQIGSLLTIDG